MEYIDMNGHERETLRETPVRQLGAFSVWEVQEPGVMFPTFAVIFEGRMVGGSIHRGNAEGMASELAQRAGGLVEDVVTAEGRHAVRWNAEDERAGVAAGSKLLVAQAPTFARAYSMAADGDASATVIGYRQAARVLFSAADAADDLGHASYLRTLANRAIRRAGWIRAAAVVNGRCPVCVDHPGWNHAHEGFRRHVDYCRACMGSGSASAVQVSCSLHEGEHELRPSCRVADLVATGRPAGV